MALRAVSVRIQSLWLPVVSLFSAVVIQVSCSSPTIHSHGDRDSRACHPRPAVLYFQARLMKPQAIGCLDAHVLQLFIGITREREAGADSTTRYAVDHYENSRVPCLQVNSFSSSLPNLASPLACNGTDLRLPRVHPGLGHPASAPEPTTSTSSAML